MSNSQSDAITLTKRGKIAIITFILEQKLNALTADLYYHLGALLREVAASDEIYITILTGKGRYFSAYDPIKSTASSPNFVLQTLMLRDISGADVSAFSGELTGEELRRYWLRGFVSNNLDLTNTFSKHPKILVTALNGPVIGLSAALVAFSDFIYAAPHAFLLTPFSSLGLLAEGGSSRAFVERLGISKANEALLMSKRIDSQELLRAGFVNKIFDVKEGQSDIFLELVIKEMEERLGDHLNNESLIRIKALIRRPEREIIERQNALEVFGGLERFIEGIPQEEFRRIRSGEKRHKL